MQPALLLKLLFVLGTLVKIGALGRSVVSRLAARYPVFTVMTAFGVIRANLLLAGGLWSGHLHPYVEIWNATLAPTLALEAAACVEAFWILAMHFRNARIFGALVLGFIAAAGAVLSYSAIAVWSRRWTSPFSQAAALMEHVMLMLIVIALFSLFFFRQFASVPIRPNAIRHLGILIFLFGSMFIAGGFFANSTDRRWGLLANLFITIGPLAAYAAWVLMMKPEGEGLPFSPAPVPSDEEFHAGEARDRVAVQRGIDEARARLENLERESQR